jgi:hypothetical protein
MAILVYTVFSIFWMFRHVAALLFTTTFIGRRGT